jgi:TIR domain
MDPQIFITYSSKDQKVSQTICTALENRGLACWISSRNVKPGQNFQEQIVKAIRAAKIMVLVFTANANNSNEIKKELALASQNNLVVIPVRIEDVTPNEAFAYEFATRQWIDLFDNWENSIARLVDQIAYAIEEHASGDPAKAGPGLRGDAVPPSSKTAAAGAKPAPFMRLPGLRRVVISGAAVVVATAIYAVATLWRQPASVGMNLPLATAQQTQPPVQAAAPAPSQPAARPLVMTPKVPDQETVFWESIHDSKDAADFQAYLKQYPNGSFAGLAKNRLAALQPAKSVTPESGQGRIPTAFRWYYQFEPKGWRNWSRVDNQTWVEQYETGQVSKFGVLGPGTVSECNGLMLLKDNNSLQAFIPDDRCAQQVALFQMKGPAGFTGPWHALGDMQDTSYAMPAIH